MGFPTGPAQSYGNPNSIPGLGGFTAPTPNNRGKHFQKTSSPEPGEIRDGMEVMDGPRIDEERVVAMETKMEKLEKDNEALRKLVAHLCVGVASISDNIPKVAQPEGSSDPALDKMAADMRATVLESKEITPVKSPDTPMSDQLTEDTTSGAEQGTSSTVQYLSKSQEKVTKEFLAIQRRMTNIEASFENHRKSNAKDRADVHDTHDTQKKTTQAIRDEMKDLKRMLEKTTEGNDHERRTDLHQRIKTTMQMRLFKEQYTQLWEKLIQVAASSGSVVLDQVYSAQRGVQVCSHGRALTLPLMCSI